MDDEILLVDKPTGMSSFGVVARVRRKLSEAAGMVEVRGKDGQIRMKRKKVKVGHTGTLDPFATGLLILLTGKRTKEANEFLKLDKEYIATLELGVVSTTGDPEGRKLILMDSSLSTDAMLIRRISNTSHSASPVSANSPINMSFPNKSASPVASNRATNTSFSDEAAVLLTDEMLRDKLPEQIVHEKPNKEAVEKCVQNLVGENWQRVPNYSAVKINGQRAYKLAREGKKVEMPVRKVQIYELEVLRYEWPELVIRCKVSSGTYIRTLGEEIGKRLGVGAYLTELRRTQVGEYRIEDAHRLEDWLAEEK